MIRPVQPSGRAAVDTASALVRGPQVVRNDPDIGLITRERRGPALGGGERPGRIARLARLAHRLSRVLGWPSDGAASGGNFSRTWLQRRVERDNPAASVTL